MIVAEQEMIRVRLEPELKERWETTLQGRKISQQRAVTSLIDWLTQQEPLVQAMIFNQVPETDHGELSRLVLDRLGKRKKKRS